MFFDYGDPYFMLIWRGGARPIVECGTQSLVAWVLMDG